METLVQKKNKPPTVSNMVEQAISQLDNFLFFLLGHKVTIGTYVHLCAYNSFNALQHQLSYIFHHSTYVQLSVSIKSRHYPKKWEKFNWDFANVPEKTIKVSIEEKRKY